MIKLVTGLLILVLLCGFHSHKEQENFEIQLLFPGNYHDGEVNAKSGDMWFGLFESKDGYQLESCKLNVESVPDFLYGMDSTSPRGIKVSVDKNNSPLFLVKGDIFSDGGIKTLFSGMLFIPDFDQISFRLIDEQVYYLSIRKNPDEMHPGELMNVALILRQEKLTDTVTIFGYVSDGPPEILWAGDIDRDGKLDLLIDVATHYNVDEPTLFLSSKAKKGKLVEKVASHRSVGC